MSEGNLLAQLALLAWVPLCMVVYAKTTRVRATIIVMLSGILVLPERVAFDPPGLPPFDKNSLTSIALLLGCAVYGRRALSRVRPGRGVEALVPLLLVGSVGTVLTNTDKLVYADNTLPALTLYDALSVCVRDMLYVGIPFFIARAMFRQPKALLQLMHAFVIAGLAYSLLALIEVRLSPQLHNWLYGFIQHSWLQVIRGGGYRPMVFMAHGLAVALFFATCVAAALGLGRIGRRVFRIPAGLIGVYLLGVLVLCNSMGALVYGLLGAVVVAFMSPKWQTRAAAAVAALALLYPALRSTNLFPADEIVAVAGTVKPERAESLAFRFANEADLMDKARERLWFGWGAFGRNRVYDPETGKEMSVTDGAWIIEFGSRGLVGFVAIFGLLTLPLFMAWRALPRIRSKQERHLLGAFAMMTAIQVIDLLPNGMFTPFPFFFSGALLGQVEALPRRVAAARRAKKRARRLQLAQATEATAS